ncbi:hypothetical protein D3C80_1342100 [compost metagenome]
MNQWPAWNSRQPIHRPAAATGIFRKARNRAACGQIRPVASTAIPATAQARMGANSTPQIGAAVTTTSPPLMPKSLRPGTCRAPIHHRTKIPPPISDHRASAATGVWTLAPQTRGSFALAVAAFTPSLAALAPEPMATPHFAGSARPKAGRSLTRHFVNQAGLTS